MGVAIWVWSFNLFLSFTHRYTPVAVNHDTLAGGCFLLQQVGTK